MKKAIAIFLLLLITMSSCIGCNNSSPISCDHILITNKMPCLTEEYRNNTQKSPADIGNVFEIKGDGLELTKSDGIFNIEVKLSLTIEALKNEKSSESYTIKKAGIIYSEETFSEYFERTTGKMYRDYYPDDFFTNNYVIYLGMPEFVNVAFLKFNYTFDKESKTLIIGFTESSHEGWKDNQDLVLGTYNYFLSIPKDVIRDSGKTIPYEDLKIEAVGSVTIEKNNE